MTRYHVLAVCVVTILGCGEEKAPAAPAAEDRAVTLGPEDFAVATRQTLAEGPRLSGSLAPRREAVIRAETGGQVLAVEVELGQTVAEGDLLARIERGQANDQVASAVATRQAAATQLDIARRERDRVAGLVRAGALAQRELDNAESAVAAAQARLTESRAHLSTAREQLGDSVIRAPFAGVVSQREVNEGDVVAPGAVLFTVLDPSSMRLEASVSAAELPQLSQGAQVHFTVRGYPDEVFTGTIGWIAPAADRHTRQIPILVEIPNDSGRLIAHLYAEGRVAAGERETLVVPALAIDESGDSPRVTRIRDGVVEHATVVLGARDEATGRVEIVEGLSAGDVVLVRGARNVPPGTPVIVPEGGARAERAPSHPRPEN